MPGVEGTIRVQVPFSVTDIQQCKQKLGRYSEDPSKFADGFQTLAFDISRKDIEFILATCRTIIVKGCILTASGQEADEAFVGYPQGNAPG